MHICTYTHTHILGRFIDICKCICHFTFCVYILHFHTFVVAAAYLLLTTFFGQSIALHRHCEWFLFVVLMLPYWRSLTFAKMYRIIAMQATICLATFAAVSKEWRVESGERSGAWLIEHARLRRDAVCVCIVLAITIN